MRTEGGLCCISASPLSSCHARGGHPAVPISPYMSHVPTSLRPHILISPYPHVPFPMSATPPVALLCLLLKEQRRKAAPLSPNPQSRGSAVWARRPPCPLCHPRVSPCHRVPPPHETPMLPSLKMNLRPRLGAQRGAVGLGRGVWGGLCVCVSAHVRAPPFPLQPGEVSRAAGSGAGLGVRACTRVLAQFAHAEPCVPSAVHRPPLAQLHTYHTHTHTHTIHARRSVAQQHDVGGLRGGQKGGGRSPAGCRLLAASRPALSRRVGKPLLQR